MTGRKTTITIFDIARTLGNGLMFKGCLHVLTMHFPPAVAGLPIVDNVEKGFNSSVFAYGQTGAGKTFTMTGRLSRDNDQVLLHSRI